jgi:hypothetical protein
MIHNSIQNQFMLADQLSISESASHSRMQQDAAGCWFLLSFQQLLASQKSHRRFGLFHGEAWLGREATPQSSRDSAWLGFPRAQNTTRSCDESAPL